VSQFGFPLSVQSGPSRTQAEPPRLAGSRRAALQRAMAESGPSIVALVVTQDALIVIKSVIKGSKGA
jgi:hypothetical protein